jgi:hypothetical protein
MSALKTRRGVEISYAEILGNLKTYLDSHNYSWVGIKDTEIIRNVSMV